MEETKTPPELVSTDDYRTNTSGYISHCNPRQGFTLCPPQLWSLLPCVSPRALFGASHHAKYGSFVWVLHKQCLVFPPNPKFQLGLGAELRLGQEQSLGWEVQSGGRG